MWVMKLQIPIHALQGEAILRRLLNNPLKRAEVEKDVRILMKGYYGEKNFSYYLSLLPEEKYYIFQGLRLRDNKKFQIDVLLLSPYFALIAEVKNINGTIRIDKNTKQMIREFENKMDGFQNPVLQAERQEIQLKSWLFKRKISQYPVESLAIMSNSTTIIDTVGGDPEDYKKLIFSESFLKKLTEFEKKYTNPVLSKNKLLQLTETLQKAHTIDFLDIFQIYGISQTDLIKGVQCNKCKKFQMKYISAKWQCPYCKYQSKTSYIQAVIDFSLLIDQTITRTQFKEFLQINTQQAKSRLSTMNLPSIGSKRGTKYIISPFVENPTTKGEI